MSSRGSAVPLHLRGVVLPGGEKRDVYVVDGRISFDEPADAVSVLDEGFLIPGLVDVHAHLGLASPAPEGSSDQERARASLRAQPPVIRILGGRLLTPTLRGSTATT